MSNAVLGFTVTGAALGALTPIKNIVFPAVSQNLERIRTAGDANDAGQAYYQNYNEGAITVTFRKNVTVRNALLTRCRAGTTDAFTITKTGEHTYSGNAFVQNVGEITYADGDPEYTVAFKAETEWTVAAA